MDTNGDGKLQEEEIPERFRGFMQQRFKDAGFDPSEPVVIEDYLRAARERREREYSGDRGRDGDRRDDDRDDRRDRDDADEPSVPGFGEAGDLPAVRGFGDGTVDGGSSRRGGVPLEDAYDRRIVDYVGGILRRYDRNNDQILDEEEIRHGRWRDPPPKESDRDGDGRLSRSELYERVSKYREFAGSSSSGGSSSSTSSRSSGNRDKYAEYASSLVKRYDKNDNGVLEKEEWSNMSRYHHAADKNGDKVITKEELTDRLTAYAKGSSGGSGGSSSRSSRDEPAEPGDSYRVTGEGSARRITPNVERLPKGLPDWFTRNDADADGQIAMHEFAVSWTDSKLAEFKKLDANGDGVVTPAECLAGESKSSSSRYRRR